MEACPSQRLAQRLPKPRDEKLARQRDADLQAKGNSHLNMANLEESQKTRLREQPGSKTSDNLDGVARADSGRGNEGRARI